MHLFIWHEIAFVIKYILRKYEQRIRLILYSLEHIKKKMI